MAENGKKRRVEVTPEITRTEQCSKLTLLYRFNPEEKFSVWDHFLNVVPFWNRPELALKIMMGGVERTLGQPTVLKVTELNPTFPCDSGCFVFEPSDNITTFCRKFVKRSKVKSEEGNKEIERGFQLDALVLNLFSKLRSSQVHRKTKDKLIIHTPNFHIYTNPESTEGYKMPEGVYDDNNYCVIAMDYINNAIGHPLFVNVGEDIQALVKIKNLILSNIPDQNFKNSLVEICDSKLKSILGYVANANVNLKMKLQHLLTVSNLENKVSHNSNDFYNQEILDIFNKIKKLMYKDDYESLKSNNLWQLSSISKMRLQNDAQWVKRVSELQENLLRGMADGAKHIMSTRDCYLHDIGIFDETDHIIPYLLDFDKVGLESRTLDYCRIFLDWRIDWGLHKRLKVLEEALKYELGCYGSLILKYKGKNLSKFIVSEMPMYMKEFLLYGISIIQHSLAINYDARINRPSEYKSFSEIPERRYEGQLVKWQGFVDKLNAKIRKKRFKEINKREIVISPAQTSKALTNSLNPLFSELLQYIANSKESNVKFSDEDKLMAARVYNEYYSRGLLGLL